MPVYVSGMHRSGTSMVTRLLHLCGLYLGEEQVLVPGMPSNPEGHFENKEFVKTNELILKELGGNWYSPPQLDPGWEKTASILKLSDRTSKWLVNYEGRELWGWKDPRNCLLLPFWMNIVPDIKVVVCLRNPLEVVESLQRREMFSYSPAGLLGRIYKQPRAALSVTRQRSFSFAACLKLWKTYNERILEDTVPRRRIITHYDAYFRNANAELRRVLDFLNMTPTEEAISRASTFASGTLRHHRFTSDNLLESRVPVDVLKLYKEMMSEAEFGEPRTRSQMTR